LLDNPLIDEIEALEAQLRAANSKLPSWKTKLAWYQAYNFDAAHETVQQCVRSKAEAYAARSKERETEKRIMRDLAENKPYLDMGMDPRYWFSPERAIARRLVDALNQDLSTTKLAINRHQSQIDSASKALARAASSIHEARAFDPLLAQATITGLQSIVTHLTSTLELMRQRNDKLESAIEAPKSEIISIELEQADLAEKIRLCKYYNYELTSGGSKSERDRLRAKCLAEVGSADPVTMLGKLQQRHDRNARLINKMTRQVKGKILIATSIKHIVIDGNNLCYDDDQFFGTAALEVLVPEVAKRFRVSVFFDNVVQRNLGMTKKQIENLFKRFAEVHICKGHREADPYVLAHANDAECAVLTSDLYREWKGFRAVSEGRILLCDVTGETLSAECLDLILKVDRTRDVAQQSQRRGNY